MNNSNQSYLIDPNKLYTPLAVASVLQVDEKWVKTNLIYNRACRHRKQGNVYFLLGKWIIEWAERDHNLPPDEK